MTLPQVVPSLPARVREGAGIYCRNDVHVVLQYWNRNVDGIDIMVGEGLDDLKDFVDFVNANNDAAIARNGNRLASENYYVSALIQNGARQNVQLRREVGDIGAGNIRVIDPDSGAGLDGVLLEVRDAQERRDRARHAARRRDPPEQR